jgi:hypothetical protein
VFGPFANALGARLNGYFGNRSSPQRRDVPGRPVPSSKVATITFLPLFRASLWSVGSFFSQVVVHSRGPVGYRLMSVLVGAVGLVWASYTTFAADYKFKDVSVTSGEQLTRRFKHVMGDPSAQVAVAYFAERKLHVDYEGLAEIKFRVDNSPDYFSLFLIPLAGPAEPNNQLKHLVLVAERSLVPDHKKVSTEQPRNSRVLLGTISTEGKQIEVKEESIVAEGKVQPAAQGQLKSFFKCAVGACVPAGLGCLYGGPSWLPCFCLWCGGAIASCGLLEAFYP